MPVFLNGAFVEEADACIRIDDRGFLFGHAVFETVRLHRGGFFRLDSHLERLAAGAQALAIPMPAAADLIAAARELAQRNATTEGMLRIVLTPGPAGRRPGPASTGPGTVLVTLNPMLDDWRARAERGWRIVTARTPHPPAYAAPRHLKAQGRVYNVLARLEAEAAGADDALLLSPDGHVAEGPTWNVFWRRGDRFYTPGPETGVLEGVTRAEVLALLAERDAPVSIGRFARSDLDAADEVFATMSSLGIVPIRELDGRPVPPDAAAAAPRLTELYWERVRRQTEAGTAPGR